jgi:hypothetical protein
MSEKLDQLRRAGWRVAETGLLLVILCVLLDIILGSESSGGFVASVAGNAKAFLQSLPSGPLIGLALIAAAYWLANPRASR